MRSIIAALLLAFTSCATPQLEQLRTAHVSLPERGEARSVPFIAQEQFYCGPAALAMALNWSGLNVTQEAVATEVYTPGRLGTLVSDVVTSARRHGRMAVQLNELHQVLAELAVGHPVIVFQNLAFSWYPQWHFAVAVGYDLTANTIILHSGLNERHKTRLSTFERTWRRGGYWALVVLPPDVLPAYSDELEILRSAAGIERTGRLLEAEIAYITILSRWPESLGGWIGLANARYGMGDLLGTENALRYAVINNPAAPVAWNNLAYVLAERGQRSDAEAAAREAIRLAGTDATRYEATLREILDKSN